MLVRFASAIGCSVVMLGVPAQGVAQQGETHTYYVAAEEVDWDYAPSNLNQMTGRPFEGRSLRWVGEAADRIGKVYRKAVYREFTDASFSTMKVGSYGDTHSRRPREIFFCKKVRCE